jgi:foldase protein PrsA
VNSSKKSIKYPKQEVKQAKKINPKVWIITSTVLIVALIGSLLFDQLYKRSIITINGDKYYLEDLAYYFYGVESSYDYFNQMFGGQYWDMVIDQSTGESIRDIALEEAVDTSLYNEILYREAIAQGYTLTDDEKETIEEDVSSLMDEQLTEGTIKKAGFTKEYLTDVLGKTTLVERFKQDTIDALNIDDEAIKAEIDFEEFRQYDVEYLFISTEKDDEDGKSIPMDETEKSAAYEKINSYYTKAKETEDWTTLIPEEEEDVIYKEDDFIKKDTAFSDELENIIMAMDNNTISEILEDESGYYVVRMINNRSTERYDDEVEAAIEEAEEEAFEEAYEELLKNFDYKINNSALRRLRMGTITLAD